LTSYYYRPTYPDLQIEERGKFTQASYQSGTIYEWNIDGMNEYHIINKLQEMTMVSNAHKIRNNSDKAVANILIAGFTGQIKGWWDNVLTTQQQNEILESIQVNELKEPILDTDNQTIEDAMSTLIYNIANYFVGDPTYLKDRTADQLSNLRCRKLQDFRWYKDTFMTKVLTREDANQPYWKEKFITGLPTLFAEKIKNKYREKHKGVVPYEKLTYGDIVSTITKTGLEICYDIKMSKQIKRDSKTYKKELGDFCTQFGYETFKPPPSKDLQKPKIDRKNYYKKQFEKPEYYRKPNKRKTHFKTNKFKKSNNDFPKTNPAICYNCGKSGHIAKYCYIRKIKKLDLTKDHRNQIFKIIDNQILEEGESDYFSTSSTKIQAIKNSSSESEFSSNNSKIKTCNCNNCIIGTTSFLLTNQSPPRRILLREGFLHQQITNEPSTSMSQPYTLQKIFQRFEDFSTPNITLQDLQKEIKDTKQELQKFKQKTKKRIIHLEQVLLQKHSSSSSDKEIEQVDQGETSTKFIHLIERITYQKWHVNITVTIQDSFKLQTIALIDSGAQMNCIQELIPTKYFEKTKQKLSTANGKNLRVNFKVTNVHICNEGICIKQSFILVKDLDIGIIIGQPFLEIIKPFKVTNEGITTKLFQNKILFAFNKKPITKEIDLLKTFFLFKEHSIKMIETKENHLSNKKRENQLPDSQIKEKILSLKNNIIKNLCSDLPNAFWHRKRHMVSL
ncbi:LOW QUALITY PROTEIN: zf-CCHC domain-containing protein, partial [Cephalotus follicularis]